MADFIQALDPAKLLLAETVSRPSVILVRRITHYALRTAQALAFIISPFTVPAYNLPIFLFGSYVQESSDAAQSLTLVRIVTPIVLGDWHLNKEPVCGLVVIFDIL